MKFNEGQFDRWAKPPSETEEGKSQHTVERIRRVLTAKFGSGVSIFLQGSYKNRTNIRLDSDVDIIVRYNDIYFGNVSALSAEDKVRWDAIPSAPYTFAQFKNEVQAALISEFSSNLVKRHNKCVEVLKNDQRVNADVVPCFVHKRFSKFEVVAAEGIQFKSDNGETVINFPEQHYDNGVSKNQRTKQMYKAVVRILKNVRNSLIDAGVLNDGSMASYFLECLVWNVPDEHFLKSTYSEATRAVIVKVWSDMGDPALSDKYAEVCDLHWLFKSSDRTPAQAKEFMGHAWSYLGFT